jgi:integrase
MPRPRPPHLHHERTRHGTLVWYVRVGHGPRIRLRAPYGTKEFMAEYQAALAGEKPGSGPRKGAGTVAWLIERYKESSAWSRLAAATRGDRGRILRHISEAAGDVPVSAVRRKHIIASLEKRSPVQARNYLIAVRGLFKWAVYAEHVEADPTQGIPMPQYKSDGFHTWSAEEMAAFEARWPVGTRERLAFDVLLYTGLRRSDAVKLGRQHVKDGVFTLKTSKTGEVVSAPILPPLARSIEACPPNGLTFIESSLQAPFTPRSFTSWFSLACKEAGLRGCSPHGLRKAAATRAAEAGASERQLDAMFAWKAGSGMSGHYTRAADRKRLASAGMGLIENAPGTSIPAPRDKVRD